MVPTDGIRDQVTAVLLDPAMVAVNCGVCEADRLTPAGASVMDTVGDKLTVALALLVESAALVAVTVTFCAAAMLAGAVYRPFEIVPTGGVRVQVTAVLLEPATVAVNCWVCEADRLTPLGASVMDTVGDKLTVALALLVESAALVAMTVTFCAAVMVAGAV